LFISTAIVLTRELGNRFPIIQKIRLAPHMEKLERPFLLEGLTKVTHEETPLHEAKNLADEISSQDTKSRKK
jgi:hypothetical protein